MGMDGDDEGAADSPTRLGGAVSPNPVTGSQIRVPPGFPAGGTVLTWRYDARRGLRREVVP